MPKQKEQVHLNYPQIKKSMAKRIHDISRRRHARTVFSDAVALMALAVSNQWDLSHWDEREKEYLKIAGKYTREELDEMSRLFGELQLGFQIEPRDLLGELYMELEFGNKHTGQFFTPWCVCQLMTGLSLDVAAMKEKACKNEFVTAMDPACGGAAMLLAIVDNLINAGIDHQALVHVTAVDVDLTAVHMAYLQLSLAGVPGIVIHGDSLKMKEYSKWYTPPHILGGWSRKLRSRENRPEETVTVPAEQLESAGLQIEDLPELGEKAA